MSPDVQICLLLTTAKLLTFLKDQFIVMDDGES